MAKKRKITAEDLYAFRVIQGCEISPDGRHVAYSVQRVDKATEKKYSDLWIAPTGSGSPRQFTYGDHTDSMPRWSPDGKSLAFLSNRKSEQQMQIHVLPFEGGEARPLTGLKGSIGSMEWSPDGKQILIGFRKKDPAAIEREQDEQKKKLGVVERHITQVHYKMDAAGFLPEEKWHLWLINAKSGKATQLTQSDHHEQSGSWSPDGKSVVFLSNRAKDPGLEPEKQEIYILTVESGRQRKVGTRPGAKMYPRFSPDGKWISYVQSEKAREWWRNNRIWVAPVRGKGRPRNLTYKLDRNVCGWTIADVGEGAIVAPCWSNDSSRIYFQSVEYGNTELQSVTLDRTPKIKTHISSSGVVGAFSFDRDQSRLAYWFADMTQPGQLFVRPVDGNADAKQLTKENESLLRRLDLGKIEEVWFKGASRNDLQGWVLKPPGFRKGRKYPSILEIHGGPLTQYGNFFMHEFYYLAAQGYVVYFSNPRGGSGYGEEHAGAIWNNWGSHDYRDLMKWADYMESQPYIDRKRMGVTGGSYGGYMTNWIIGHTHRFKAAVTQRCVSNLVSMWGTSDFNWVFQEVFGGKPPWEDVANFWRQSPMKYIGNAKTPTLVIHSEKDQRCEIEQGEQVFVALKKLGVDTEFVRFPDEPHGLSRGGRTDRRIARLNHILRWMDTYLK